MILLFHIGHILSSRDRITMIVFHRIVPTIAEG